MFIGMFLFSKFYKYKRKFRSYSTFLTNKTDIDKLKVLFFGTDTFSLPSLIQLYKERVKITDKGQFGRMFEIMENNLGIAREYKKSESDFKAKVKTRREYFSDYLNILGPPTRSVDNCKSQITIQSVGVVTSFKKPINPVRNFANKKNLQLYKWPVDTEIASNYDLGVVVSFGHLIPEKIISSFPHGMINVHASILPRWRGAAPIIYAIMKGDTETGVSIMKIEPKHFDTGDILGIRKIVIRKNILLPELHEKLSVEGANLLIEKMREIPQSLHNAQKQSSNFITYAPKITPAIAEVNWNAMNAEEVYNLYRALYSFKSITTKWFDQTVKLIEIKYDASQTECLLDNKEDGFVYYSKPSKSLRVLCKGASYIDVTKISIGGKKVMTASEFNNGFLKKVSSDKTYFKQSVL